MIRYFFILVVFTNYVFSLFGETNQLFVMTIPKSGTFITAKAIRMLTGISIGGSVMNHYNFTDSFLLENPNIATTAHLVENYEPLRTNNRVKRILVVRDLRDVCISAVYHLRKYDWYSYAIDHAHFYNMEFDDQLSYMIDLKHSEYSIKSFARRAILWMNTPGVLTIRFEDLVGEKGGGSRERQIQTLKNIADYLEVPVSQEILGYVADNLFGGGGTFRKGQINGWKTQFNEKNKTLVHQVLGEELYELGYCDW